MIGLDRMMNRTLTLPDGRLATNLPGDDEVWVVPCPSGEQGHYVEIAIPDPSEKGTTTVSLSKGISIVTFTFNDACDVVLLTGYNTANDGEVLDKESARAAWRVYIHEGWVKLDKPTVVEK